MLFSTEAFSQCACSCSGGSAVLSDYTGTLGDKKNRFSVEAAYDYKSFKPHVHTATHVHNHGTDQHVEEEAGLEMHGMSSVSLGLHYGVTNKLTVLAFIPFAMLHADPSSYNGIGDASLLGMYKLYGSEKFAVGGVAGVEIPVGKRMPETLSTDVVIGSGSFDPFGGLVASYSNKKFTARWNGMYKYNTEGLHNTTYGNVFTSSLSIGYGNATAAPCLPASEAKPVWQVNGIALVEQNDASYKKRVVVENSGSTILYGGSGVTLTVKKFSLPLSVLIPVYQHLNGEQHSIAFKARIGAALTF
ncbi:MAG TPA: hypothetical protein VEY71_07995 [Chitinophagales bacterium]|nr:hypothetical protein [Chitinophagales bacterium]